MSALATAGKTNEKKTKPTEDEIKQLLVNARLSLEQGQGEEALQAAMMAMKLNTQGNENEMMKILENAKYNAKKARDEVIKNLGAKTEEEAAEIASQKAMMNLNNNNNEKTNKKKKKKKKKKKRSTCSSQACVYTTHSRYVLSPFTDSMTSF